MDDQAWDLLKAQLSRIEQQNHDQLVLMHEHIADDNKMRAIVDRHSTYFGGLSLFLPGLATYVLTKLGLK